MNYTYTHIENIDSPTTSYTTCKDSNDVSVVIPSEFKNDGTVDETLSESLALKAYHQEVGSVKTQLERYQGLEGKIRDKAYMNGALARTDYAVTTDEGKAIVDKLKATWPDEVTSYDNNPINLVSEYTAQRPPYTNDSISFYEFTEASDSIKATFSANYEEYKHWYGLKFDTVTEDVLAKFVIPSKEMERVDGIVWLDIKNKLPICSYEFFARIHDKSGNVDENVDVYFHADASIVKAWCDENSYTFPYDVSDTSIEPQLFIWGCVYNTTAKELTHIKAYARDTI